MQDEILTGGGAIYSGRINITGETNIFSGNTASTNGGGAIHTNSVTDSFLNITGGTTMFTGNKAMGAATGGAIYSNVDTVLRATDGDFTFQNNRDRVGRADEKANAVNTVRSRIVATRNSGISVGLSFET